MKVIGDDIILYAEITVLQPTDVLNGECFSWNGRETDWGDGTVNDLKSHTYSIPGNYIFTVRGPLFDSFEKVYDTESDLILFSSGKDSVLGYLTNDSIVVNYIYINPANDLKSGNYPCIRIYGDVKNVDVNNLHNGFIEYCNSNTFIALDNYYDNFASEILENKGSLTNNGLFNSEGSLNGISPKLNGRLLQGDFLSLPSNHDVVYRDTHTYTTHPNKTIKKVLINTSEYYQSDTYGSGKCIDFDTETFTVKIGSIVCGSGYQHKEKGLASIKIIYNDDTFDTDYFLYSFDWVDHCLIENTQIETINGKKYIQDISYDDLLLVWDAFRGQFAYQHPYYIKNTGFTNTYLNIILEDDSEINIVGEHTFYDSVNKIYFEITKDNYDKLDLDNIYLTKIGSNKNYYPIKIKDIKVVDDSKAYYTLFTSGVQTYVSNDVLSGNVYLNYIGKINNNNSVDLTRYKQIRELVPFTYDEFKTKYGFIEEYVYYGSLLDVISKGLQLGMEKGYENIIHKKYKDIDAEMHNLRFWNDVKNIDKIYITYLSNNNTITEEHQINEEIELPKSEKGWYCVADNTIYKDKYVIKTHTVLEEM